MSGVIESIIGSGRELAELVPHGFGRRILASTERMTVVLAGFEPGQEIPAHAPDVDLVVSVLDGDGLVRIGEDVHHVRAGDVATIPAGKVRGIKAGPAGMIALHVVSPPPTDADHATPRPDLAWPEPGRATVGEAVAAEHAELRPVVDGLGELADRAGDLAPDERRRRLGDTVAFLRGSLLPHAAAEENTLYPAAERVLRARGGAVRTMTLGHERIAALVDELEAAAASDDVARLPRVLHSLRAIVLLHLDEEEQVYLPALAGLSADEAEVLAARLGIEGHHV